jgi:hypothetical protein
MMTTFQSMPEEAQSFQILLAQKQSNSRHCVVIAAFCDPNIAF